MLVSGVQQSSDLDPHTVLVSKSENWARGQIRCMCSWAMQLKKSRLMSMRKELLSTLPQGPGPLCHPVHLGYQWYEGGYRRPGHHQISADLALWGTAKMLNWKMKIKTFSTGWNQGPKWARWIWTEVNVKSCFESQSPTAQIQAGETGLKSHMCKKRLWALSWPQASQKPTVWCVG